MDITVKSLYKEALKIIKNNKTIIDKVCLKLPRYRLKSLGVKKIEKELEEPMKLIITFKSPNLIEEKL